MWIKIAGNIVLGIFFIRDIVIGHFNWCKYIIIK